MARFSGFKMNISKLVMFVNAHECAENTPPYIIRPAGHIYIYIYIYTANSKKVVLPNSKP